MANDISIVEDFTSLHLERLDSYDVLELNYCAARRLPGTEKSDLDVWLSKRDEWAARVQFEICRHLYRFNPKSTELPTEFTYGNSLARFFCYFLLQVLQEDCGVRYHPDRKFSPDFCQPRDIFAQGIMDDDGQGGTCASMPVVYVSVGRRLGFPIYLVETRGHLFFRWDDPKGTLVCWQFPDLNVRVPPDRFNVDGSGEGIAYHNDEFYQKWPEPWVEFEHQHGRLLRSMTTKEELASFLIERGECSWDLGRHDEALKAYFCARHLVKDDARYNQLNSVRVMQYFEMHEVARLRHERKRNQSMNPHGPYCLCLDCTQRGTNGSAIPAIPGHGLSCQCLHCREARSAQMPQGLPGHHSLCGCTGCRRIHQSHM